MDGSVVEGISTSLQTCPPDLQGHPALGDLPSPPYIHHLHVNDLGLTPTPGSQLQQPIDAQISSRDENHTLSGESEGACTSNKFDGNQEDTSSAAHIGSNHGTQLANNSQISQATQKLPMRDIDPIGFDGSTDTVQALFDDPLFDSEAVLRELDAAFVSRKRAGDEAFPEFGIWGPLEKRRLVETQQNQDQGAPSPGETPSLSSPDSSHQPEQGGTAPHTPGIERPQSPNSLFDSLDALFEDPDFHIPLIPGEELPPDFEWELPLPQGDHSGPGFLEQNPSDSLDSFDHILKLPDIPQELTPAEPSVSEITKQRFSLDPQDIVSNTSREVLQRIHQEPEYTSPYPVYGGPLGYVPSAPAIHVKCIEVAEDRMSYRLSHLKDRVYQLTCERNKYKNAWFQWTTIDPATGKTKEQLLREENAMLRRVSTQHQNRVEQYKHEATEWKNRLHELGTIYNNLLYEIHVQRQIPAVAPIPDSYKPPRTSQASRGPSLTPNPPPVAPTSAAMSQAMSQSHSPAPRDMPPDIQGSQPLSSQGVPGVSPGVSGTSEDPRSIGSQLTSRPTPVTIDLTDETQNKPVSSKPSAGTQRRMEMLQSLRNKRYGWLESEHTGHGFRHTSASQSRRLQRDATPLTERSRSDPSGRTAAHNSSIADDDELARAIEAELAAA
ncbi:hypothetical protein BBP40_010235 [Aspergillus hancockii]|nr:hypothetical protein BBP40_010235 [Aspergillus hancockii]